jgi:hypothetical protein
VSIIKFRKRYKLDAALNNLLSRLERERDTELAPVVVTAEKAAEMILLSEVTVLLTNYRI